MTTAPESQRSLPRVVVQFSRTDRQYEPAAPFEIRYEADGLGDDPPKAVEHCVLWFTEGKGEEDLGVSFFERVVDRGRLPPAAPSGQFSCRLPRSPLTYEGVIVKIRWCVRIRFFFENGRDFVSEHEFLVGRLPPARIATAIP